MNHTDGTFNYAGDTGNDIKSLKFQTPEQLKVQDNAIHRINHYPVDTVVCFVNIYPLDSGLSGG